MINAIDFNNHDVKFEFINEINGELKYLPNIKHINVFVGENNCGKSRLLRSIVTSDSEIYFSNSNVSSAEYSILSSKIKNSFSELHKLNPNFKVSIKHDELEPCELYVFYLNQLDYLLDVNKEYPYPVSTHLSKIRAYLQSVYEMIVMYDNNQRPRKKSVKRVYIPVLRGVECFNLYFDRNKNRVIDSISMNNDQRNALNSYMLNVDKMYRNKIVRVYGFEDDCVFTGEELFEDITNKLLGSERERSFIRSFEAFINRNFFDNKGFSVIPNNQDKYLCVKIGNSSERALHDLGDGIKQLICILYKVYELKNSEAIICIEEPEINLHPGYQRKLMDILQQEEFFKLNFFISTHSNHIVDSCFDYSNVSVFKFINIDKDNNNKFQVINTKHNDIDILNLLGVNNSSVFMANCTIWVEGISDKIYLNKYLKTYALANGHKEFIEGVDYSFVEYGGNNIVHWAFDDALDEDLIKASGITNRAFIVVDNDNDSKSKVARKEKLMSLFGENYCELQVREIENTIGNKLLEKHLKHIYPSFKDGFTESVDSIEKKSIVVWEFIDSHYNMQKKYWNEKKKQPTVSKLLFAKEVCSEIESEKDLSKNAKRIAKQLYDFIDRVNMQINT